MYAVLHFLFNLVECDFSSAIPLLLLSTLLCLNSYWCLALLANDLIISSNTCIPDIIWNYYSAILSNFLGHFLIQSALCAKDWSDPPIPLPLPPFLAHTHTHTEKKEEKITPHLPANWCKEWKTLLLPAHRLDILFVVLSVGLYPQYVQFVCFVDILLLVKKVLWVFSCLICYSCKYCLYV